MGLDHIAAMVAVGLWAAQLGGRALWIVPLAFVTLMSVGGVLGMAGIAMPSVELAIMASVLVLGMLIAAARRWPLLAANLLVGVFALFHGHAHGAEMPVTAHGSVYAIGFIAATCMLHGCGIWLGLLAQKSANPHLIRYAGGAVAAFGIYLGFA